MYITVIEKNICIIVVACMYSTCYFKLHCISKCTTDSETVNA